MAYGEDQIPYVDTKQAVITFKAVYYVSMRLTFVYC